MCTVTYIPHKGNVYIASNRDEQLVRKSADKPAMLSFNSGKILYPKDGEKGGTWIATHGNGNVMVLLNGAFDRHRPNPPYMRSRGLVFLDIFDSHQPHLVFDEILLDGVEPFTLVLWHKKNEALHEMRWDGSNKYITEKDNTIPQIWSSVTLYDKDVIQKREQWFERWLANGNEIDVHSVSHFHEFGGEGDERIDLKMSRGGVLKTVSITVVECSDSKSTMYYKDMLTGVRTVNEWLHSMET